MPLIQNKIKELFGFDLRSLAALRIAVSVLIIGDLISRSRDLVAHYTDFGAVPRAVVTSQDRWRISVHLMNGTWEIQAVLFIVTGFFALMLLAGYRTRLMTAILWFLMASLDSRNPLIADGGDVLLRLTLFWGFFLPWGACFSVDRAIARAPEQFPKLVFSAATFAYTAQIVLIYAFSVYHKTSPEWRTEGTAVHYALHLIQMANPVAGYLAAYPRVTRLLTHGIFWFQAIAPWLLFFPFQNSPIRTATVFAFLLLHLGMGSSMQIGLFSWIAAAAMIVFLPPWFWDKALQRFRSPESTPIKIYYDAGCGFCFRFVRLLQAFALARNAQIHPAQADPTIESDMARHNSWVVVDETGKKYFCMDGARIVLQNSWLRFLASVLGWPIFTNLGNRIYAKFAAHRKSVCPLERREITTSASNLPLPLGVSLLVLLLLGYVFVWNLSTGPLAKFQLSERWRSVGYLLRLDQIWNPFSPSPPRASEWYVIEGKLADGRVVDVLRDGENPSVNPPIRHFSNYRWRKYFEIVGKPNNLERLRDYARYACRDWNRRHAPREKASNLEIYWLVMHTLPSGGSAKPEVFSLLKHSCDEVSGQQNFLEKK